MPEVETIRRHLAPHVEGRTLRRLEVLDERWSRPLAPLELAAAVEGRTVTGLARRGKYLVWELEDEVFLLVHLRMTGTLLLDPPGAPPHTRVWLRLDGCDLAFTDPRRFGTGELALGAEQRDAFFAARLGVEPYGAGVHRRTPPRAREALAGADQGVPARPEADRGRRQHLRGRGAVPRPRASRCRPANRLTTPQAQALRDAILASLDAGIAAKGATIDDFRDPDGVSGTFQDRFLVHRREGEPCPRCGRIVRKLRAAGRGTYVCEGCQPRPRRA